MMARNRPEQQAQRLGVWSALALVALVACSKPPSASVEAASGEPAPAAAEAKGSEPAAAATPAAQAASVAGPAQLGAAAPDFTLQDLDGKSVSLPVPR
jgi:hypothetical protein